MKVKNLLITLLIISSFSVKGQSLNSNSEVAEVEKYLFNVQAGLLGVWASYEHQIAPRIAMRYNLGVNAGLWGGNFTGTGFLTTPSFGIEPRFYHNLNKRLDKGKNIKGNSGNFISLRILYQPSLVITTTDERRKPTTYLAVTPTYGIRRILGEHFNYELGLGLGYGYRLIAPNYANHSRHFLDVNLHIRIGYTF
jgi:hypothetical protein